MSVSALLENKGSIPDQGTISKAKDEEPAVKKTCSLWNTISSLWGWCFKAKPDPVQTGSFHHGHRPGSIQRKVDATFDGLKVKEGSDWGMNGSHMYDLCGIKECELLRSIVFNAPTSQKDFYVMDVGAGNFSMSRTIEDYVNEHIRPMRPDITVHIIGVRGEKNKEPAITRTGNCVRYDIGAFKIENMEEEFRRLNLPGYGQIDLAVSAWTLRHLVDPVGTFQQVCNSLRTSADRPGFFLFDGFFFEQGEDPEVQTGNRNMMQLLLDTKCHFIMQNTFYTKSRGLNEFVLSKTSDVVLPLRYRKVKADKTLSQVHSQCTTQFTRTAPRDEILVVREFSYGQVADVLCGSKNLFDWLRANRVISQDRSSHRELQLMAYDV